MECWLISSMRSENKSKVQCPKSKVQSCCGRGDVGPLTLDIGHWTLDFGHWTLDIGHWTLDIGQLDIGHWTLDFGHWTYLD
jgi:hypothetical protein